MLHNTNLTYIFFFRIPLANIFSRNRAKTRECLWKITKTIGGR
jgi:hypothetical protein